MSLPYFAALLRWALLIIGGKHSQELPQASDCCCCCCCCKWG